MFRFAVAVLAVIGLVSLIGSASATAVGIGWLLLAPIVFVFKIVFFFMIFGAIAHMVSQRHGRSWSRQWDRSSDRPWDRQWSRTRSRSSRRGWNRPSGWSPPQRGGRVDESSHDMADDLRPANQERFEEWHRMQHARKEVDSWVEIPDELDNRENR